MPISGSQPSDFDAARGFCFRVRRLVLVTFAVVFATASCALGLDRVQNSLGIVASLSGRRRLLLEFPSRAWIRGSNPHFRCGIDSLLVSIRRSIRRGGSVFLPFALLDSCFGDLERYVYSDLLRCGSLAMDYGSTDSSGTDDDLPPYLPNRCAAAQPVAAGGKSTFGALPHSRVQKDLEILIHELEQEAYCSVLWAFKAQSDAITWEKEGLITELRKELRLTNEEHRELLRRVNAVNSVKHIREWRQAGGMQSSLKNNAQTALDMIPSPTLSASQKRQKTSNSAAALSMRGSLPVLHPQPGAISLHTPASTAKQGNMAGARGKKTKPNPPCPIGIDEVKNVASESADVAENASLVGQKVMTRWPDDNSFYEAVITDYKPHEGLHALVYDMDTENETWEWVNLNEIAPEDIRRVDSEPGKYKPGGRHGPGKKSSLNGAIPGVGRGRGSKNRFSKEYMQSQNWPGRKGSQNIKIVDIKVIVKDVERILDISPPDHQEIEKAKTLLKEHEQSLVEAITKLDNMSDSENEEDQFSHTRTKEQGMAWTDWPHGQRQGFHFEGMLEGQGGSDGDHMAGDGTASNYHRDDYYGM